MMSDSVRASAFIVPLQPVRATLYYRQNVREQKDKCKHCKCVGRISPLATILRICCTAQSAYNVYYAMLDLSIYQYRSLSILYLFHSLFSSAHFRLLLALELRKNCYRMNVTHKQALNFLLVSFSFCVLLYTYKRWCNTSSLWCKFSEKLCIYESVFVRIQCAGAYNA